MSLNTQCCLFGIQAICLYASIFEFEYFYARKVEKTQCLSPELYFSARWNKIGLSWDKKKQQKTL